MLEPGEPVHVIIESPGPAPAAAVERAPSRYRLEHDNRHYEDPQNEAFGSPGFASIGHAAEEKLPHPNPN